MSAVLLDHARLAPLCEANSRRGAAVASGILLGIGAAVWIADAYPSIVVTTLAVGLVAALQHHLLLLLHEASHRLLFASPVHNEFAYALLGGALGSSADERAEHALHHRALGAADDPSLSEYLSYPLGPGAFARDALRHLSGIVALERLAARVRAGADGEWAALAAVQIVIAALLALGTGSPWSYALFWLLPLATLATTLDHFRQVVEHLRIDAFGDAVHSRQRSILCSPVEAFFFAPLCSGHHAEHHLYPSIPFHQLPALHRELARRDGSCERAPVERGWLRFLWRHAIRREPGRGPRARSARAALGSDRAGSR